MTDTPSLGRPFWTLWTSFAASNLGDGLTAVAFPLLAVSISDDARLVALVSTFRFLPLLLIGLPAGVVLDRYGRRQVVRAAQTARLVALVLLPASALAGSVTIAVLAASAFVVGAGEVFIDGGTPALVRDVTPRDALEVANARLSAAETGANMIIGPLLGALAFAWWDLAPFVATIALFLVAAVTVGLVPVPAPDEVADPAAHDPDAGRFTAAQLTGGLRYVWGHPVIRPLALAVALFSFVSSGLQAVYVIRAVDELGLSSFGFGLLLTVGAVAALGVSFLVAGLIRRTSHGTSLQAAVVFFTAGTAVVGVAPVAPVAAVGTAIESASAPMWNVVSGTVRQRLVDDEIFGRMMTAYLFVAWSMQPAGALAAGVVAEAWGADVVFLLAAALVAPLLILGRTLFARIDEAMSTAPDPAP